MVTLRPRASRIAPNEAEAMPFPNEETTPPVTNTNWVIWNSRCGAGTALRNREDRLSEALCFKKREHDGTRISAEKPKTVSASEDVPATRCANPVRRAALHGVRKRTARLPPAVPGPRRAMADGPAARAGHASPEATS